MEAKEMAEMLLDYARFVFIVPPHVGGPAPFGERVAACITRF
jgi:hypothetical protein